MGVESLSGLGAPSRGSYAAGGNPAACCLQGTYHRGNAGAVLQLKRLMPSRNSVTDFLEYGP